MNNKFTVDTHLFRELGQLLVGRDSTALIELVKNAYDADAHRVLVNGQFLEDPRRGVIRIEDDGVGMTVEEFNKGFLRIASRMKDEGSRRSRRYQRRYTGAKGIGRLAAHKLSRLIEIESVPWIEGGRSAEALGASIDWDRVEASETLTDVGDDAISVEQHRRTRAKPGTLILLKRLRQKWTKAQLGAFLTEVDNFQPPPILTGPLPGKLLAGEPLLETLSVRESSDADPGFEVELTGDFERGEDYWPTVLGTSHWVLEIDATSDGVTYAITPTTNAKEEWPTAEQQRIEQAHPSPTDGPFFSARVIVREGSADSDARGFARRAAGIRVFVEGFRVLPYGELTDDWLGIQRDTTERSTGRLRFISDDVGRVLPPVDKEALILLPNKHYFGAVFLTQTSASKLSMLVNREGFVPDAHFNQLKELVRTGVDLLTRTRASVRERDRAQRRSEAAGGGTSPKSKKERRTEVEAAFSELQAGADGLRALAGQLPKVDAAKVLNVVSRMEHAAVLSREYLSSEAMTRVLASIGLQLAAFTHELNGVLGMAETIEGAMARLRERPGLTPTHRSELARLAAAVGDLRRAVERQAAYLVDVVTPDARRRRSRQKLAERFNSAKRFVERVAEGRGIEIKNAIDPDHKSPAMFSAEITTAFTNLLTNAVKAAGESGRIRATSSQRADGTLIIRIENTGDAVEPKEGERWFRPFESTTAKPDPVLGQGMGLGLPITRDILAEVGATIAFAAPSRGYATAIEIAFPK